jgi:hypothetical protein
VTAPDGSKRVRPRATHTCPCGCGRRIGNDFLLCEDTWKLVPKDKRDRAAAAYLAAKAAMGAIVTWALEHPEARAGTATDGAIERAGTNTDGAIGAGTP